MEYALICERTGTGYSAYALDLPGCISTGATLAETERNMPQAIEFHIEGLRLHGYAVPEPTSVAAGSGLKPHDERTGSPSGHCATRAHSISSMRSRQASVSQSGSSGGL